MSRNESAPQQTNRLPDSDLSAAEIFEILSNNRRIRVLELLDDEHGDSLRDLTDMMVTNKHGIGYDSQQRKRIYVSLYQCHIPKLDDYGVVNYDRETAHITPGPEFDTVRDTLKAVSETHSPTNTLASVLSLFPSAGD